MNERIASSHAWITLAAAIAVAIAATLRGQYLWQTELLETATGREDPVRAAPEEHAVVKIDFGNGRQRMFEGSAPIFFHPLDFALKSVAETGKFSVVVKDGRIVKLADINNAAGGQWRVYRGEKQIRDPVDRVVIRNGERYVIRYEK